MGARSRRRRRFPWIYYVLSRIVIFYNYHGGSQPAPAPANAGPWRVKPSLQYLMHVEHDAVGMARGRPDKQVLHQPAVFFPAGFEPWHGAGIDQFGVDRLAALQ